MTVTTWRINEACRLRAMQDSRLMYSPVEERFDRITRIAKALFNTDAAFLTLMDDKHLWFKSMQGFTQRQIPRESSFCEYVISENALLVVEDALLDRRFINAEIVKNVPHIRFYAGHPICDAKRVPIGTLCIADTQVRTFSREQIQQLIDLCFWAEAEVKAKQDEQQAPLQIEQDQRSQMMDHLTGLWNNMGFEHLLSAQHQHYSLRHTQFAMAMLDLDGFALLRQHHGDEVADSILIQVAGLIQHKTRVNDITARVGLDKFMLVFAVNSLLELESYCDYLKHLLNQLPIPNSIDKLSACLAAVFIEPKKEQSLDVFQKQVQALMFQAKAKGPEITCVSLAAPEFA